MRMWRKGHGNEWDEKERQNLEHQKSKLGGREEGREKKRSETTLTITLGVLDHKPQSHVL